MSECGMERLLAYHRDNCTIEGCVKLMLAYSTLQNVSCVATPVTNHNRKSSDTPKFTGGHHLLGNPPCRHLTP